MTDRHVVLDLVIWFGMIFLGVGSMLLGLSMAGVELMPAALTVGGAGILLAVFGAR
jgi:hypothetical protein